MSFPTSSRRSRNLAAQGLSFGVHTVITTPRWTELKSRVRDYLGTKIEFRLGDVNDTQIDRIARDIPANRPGRAISMEKHHLMIGVPRFDGVHSAENLVEAITAAVTQIAASAHRPGAEGQGLARRASTRDVVKRNGCHLSPELAGIGTDVSGTARGKSTTGSQRHVGLNKHR